jgi:glutamate-ammonia-ligase adenylyltransferase
MRARMRAELDRSGAARIDLKQGAGGLVDLEFLLQYLVLRDSPAQPQLRVARDTPGLLAALCDAGVLAAATCAQLRDAHALLLDAGLRCTLDRRPRIVASNADIVAACTTIAAACRDNGLAFDGGDARVESDA